MLAIECDDAVSILRYFDDLPDPRSNVNRLHRLGDVIVIAICAVIAMADGPTSIAEWAVANERWLKRHLALPNGIPRKDTYRRVLSLLRPDTFQQCFSQWVTSLTNSAVPSDNERRRHVSIDGKTLRRSHDKKNGLGALHIVSAWASDQGITLGQIATDEKSNEITAIPQLLDQIDIEGAVVTIDAIGCQKVIAAKIVQGKGDYVLAMKGNHETLFEQVTREFESHLAGCPTREPISRHVEVEQGHGRLESRTYYQLTAPRYLYGRSEWKNLKTIGAVVRVYEENGIEKSDTRYYISSLRRNGKQFAAAVRSHWSIENSLHWCMDITYREDESRTRDRTFADNLAWLRRMTLSLIKRHPAKKSNIMKRRLAAWNVDFLLQVLTGKVT